MERVFEIIEEQLHLTGVEITEDSSLRMIWGLTP